MTTNDPVTCQCGGPIGLVDSNGQSCTGWCRTCEHYSLVLYHRREPVVIFLEDCHLKRGNASDQRPLGDLAMAIALVECLVDDVWPSPATIVDFGIDTPRHLGALQQAIRFGYTAYDLNRVMGDGPAITKLVNAMPRQPYGFVAFHTVYDKLIESQEQAD